ncbi:GPRNNA1 [Bugula neritina]|uniref:GPRNNA1 n=1 Tax=Bugula neritina TaxID=10212 RepID=A0A7J7KLL5_BUGNE|nr:GPRNNA1 [Bugula neritina]
MYVLTRRSMKSSTNCFLLALAIFDSLVLICTTLLVCLKPLSLVYQELVHAYVVVYVYPLALIAQTCVIWITVSFTVERYIAVRNPLKASSLCTVKRARITTFCVVIFSMVYNFSRWFEYRSEIKRDANMTIVLIPGTNLPSYRAIQNKVLANQAYESIYFSGLYLTVMCIIPVCLLTVLNYFLIQAVRKSAKERKSMRNESHTAKTSKENNITTMLVSVVAVFIICQLPALLYNVAIGIDRKMVTKSIDWQIVSIVRNFMVTLNSAVNFILYCALGQKFRKVFFKTFCKRFRRHRETSSERRTVSSTNGTISVHIPMLDKNSNSKVKDFYDESDDVDTQL